MEPSFDNETAFRSLMEFVRPYIEAEVKLRIELEQVRDELGAVKRENSQLRDENTDLHSRLLLATQTA